MNITIIGSGYMGTATAWPLSDNGHHINLVGTHLDHKIIRSCQRHRWHPSLKRALPKNVHPFFLEQLPSALENADLIVSGVNSMGVHWIGRTLAPLIRPGQKIITVTKGLETDAGGAIHILPEVLRAELPPALQERVTIAAIGGPCIAGELAGRRLSVVYFACRELETAHWCADIFQTDYYRILPTDQIVGVEMAVALKNAYALGVNIAKGILSRQGGCDQAGAAMHNLAAALFARGIAEMETFLKAFDAPPAFAHSLAGAGDMYVTSTGGRSARLGAYLGEGKTYTQAKQLLAGETLEAAFIIEQIAKALPSLEQQEHIRPDQIPLMRLLVRLIVENQPVEINLRDLFK